MTNWDEANRTFGHGLTSGERFLLSVARRAQTYFRNIGTGLNGQHEPILLARSLKDAIDAFEAERFQQELMSRR